MEKKNGSNIFLIIIIVLLLVVIGGLGFYIFKDGKEDNVTLVDDKDLVKEEEKISLDVNSAHIQEMFKNVHANYYIGADTEIYKYQKRSVSEMDDFYKTRLAANIYQKDIVKIGGGNDYIEEADVKNAYEILFGEGTYKRMDKIAYSCDGMNYSDAEKRYVNSGMGCGGTSSGAAHEEIIEAFKYNDRIEIVMASVFTNAADGNFYYYETDKVVGTYTSKDRHSEAFKNEVTTFIKNNKDKLIQYTFTFKQDKNGFYYYTGFERTNG